MTDICDMNGTVLKEGDDVNVFFTSGNGEHNHDCIYTVTRGVLGDMQLEFKELLWESYGYNQYTTHTTLCLEYNTLGVQWTENFFQLKVKDSWDENTLLRDKWKRTDQSFYIVKLEGKDDD